MPVKKHPLMNANAFMNFGAFLLRLPGIPFQIFKKF